MKKLITFLLLLVSIISVGQGTLVFGTNTVEEARTKLKNNSANYTLVKVDSVFKIVGLTNTYDIKFGDAATITNRTLTLNAGTGVLITGGTQNLSANRSWTISLPQSISTSSSPEFLGVKLTNGAGLGKVLMSSSTGVGSWNYLAKADVGLDSVENIPPSSMPFSIPQQVAVNAKIAALTVENIAELRTIEGLYDGEKKTILGYYTNGDGGGGDVYWNETSTATDNGGTVIQVTGVSTGRWLRMKGNVITVKEFGAKGDFDPTTGTGTNDRTAIQKAFDYATSVGNVKIVFTKGKYYGGNAIGTKAGGVHIALGDTIANSANNIEIEGSEAELYPGYEGRFIGIFGANRVTITGLKIVGYTGGTLSSARERDALITVNYYSRFVTIERCYLTNSLGDCIYAGGSLVSGGQTGYYTENLVIRNNVLKERQGNGVESFVGGTKSRLAIAVIDCINGEIHNNTIFGGVDLEPNLNNQHIFGVQIYNNKFRSGPVTAQSTISTSYWHDEPINSAGTVIEQAATITGTAGSPIIENNSVRDNTFESGLINSANVYSFDEITGNIFKKGLIEIGFTSGSNYTGYVIVRNNSTRSPKDGETVFIKLSGLVYYCVFQNNVAKLGFTNLINNNGVSTGDGSRNVYTGNILMSGTDVIGSALLATIQNTSVVSNNVKNTTSRNYTESGKITATEVNTKLVTIAGATGSQTLNYATYGGSLWYITIPTATNGSITDITNEIGDGQVLTIQAGTAGGGTLTLVHDLSYIRLKGATNVVLAAGEIITLMNRAGIWFEVSR